MCTYQGRPSCVPKKDTFLASCVPIKDIKPPIGVLIEDYTCTYQGLMCTYRGRYLGIGVRIQDSPNNYSFFKNESYVSII